MDSKHLETKPAGLGQVRRGYHHGNLREALIEAARVLIAQKGPEGLTLSEAAKLVGVTAAAPYRHFADRRALLNELAQIGFQQFADHLENAWDAGQPDARSAYLRVGLAYMAFVQNEPGLYAAMFSNYALLDEKSVSGDAVRAREILFASTRAVVRALGGEEALTHMIGVQVWALTHGVATLGTTSYLNNPIDVLSQGIERILDGNLGARQQATPASDP
jgi:AcrR family transcriptional regulator